MKQDVFRIYYFLFILDYKEILFTYPMLFHFIQLLQLLL